MLTMGVLLPALASGQRLMWVWGAPSDGVLEFSVANGATEPYLHTPPLVTTEASLASSMGRDFVIGIETGSVGFDKVSFAEEEQPTTEHDLSLVEAHFGSTPGFGGVVIHHYGAYSSMAP